MKKPNVTMVFVCCVLVALVSCSKPEPVVEAETDAAVETVAAEMEMDDAEAAARHDVVFACA